MTDDTEEPQHVDYPHWPGTLYDCPACEPELSEDEEREYDQSEYGTPRH